MANLCDFTMKVKGKDEDIRHFHNALIQKGGVWMGRGAQVDDPLEIEGDGTASISGWCSWSIQSALIDNAISMRTEPEKWAHDEGWENREYVSLFEACERWNLVAEVYSQEPGLEFQEHYLCDRGNVLCDETVHFEEYDVFGFDNKEEAEEELGVKFTDAEWANKEDDIITRGGFSHFACFDDLSSYIEEEKSPSPPNRLAERIKDASERTTKPSTDITPKEQERS